MDEDEVDPAKVAYYEEAAYVAWLKWKRELMVSGGWSASITEAEERALARTYSMAFLAGIVWQMGEEDE